jgi:hypothetical protein
MRQHANSVRSVFERLEHRVLLATIHWDGGGDGTTWHDAANWENDTLPGPLDTAIINLTGSNPVVRYTMGETNVYRLLSAEDITISGGRLIVFEYNWMRGRLTIDGGTLLVGIEWQQLGPVELSAGAIDGIGAFVIKNTFMWTGGSLGDQAVPSGRVQITGAGSMAINGNVTLDRVLVNDGLLDWQSGTISIKRGTLYNLAGRTITMPAAATITAAVTPVGLIVNRGTIDVPDGATIGVRYYQTAAGTTNLTGGVLTFRRGGYIAGALNVAAGTELAVAGDVLGANLNILASASWDMQGLLRVTGGRLGIKPAGLTLSGVTISGGHLYVFDDVSIGDLALSLGRVAGPGDVEITGSLSWTGGDIITASGGTLHIASGAAATVFLGQNVRYLWRDVTIDGSMAFAGGQINMRDAFSVTVNGSLLFTGVNPFSMLFATGVMTLLGSVIKTGAATATLAGRVGSTVSGPIIVSEGELRFLGATMLSGSADVAQGTVLGLGSSWLPITPGAPTVGAQASIGGAGTLRVVGASQGTTTTLLGTIHLARLLIEGRVTFDDAAISVGLLELAPGGRIVGDDDLVLPTSFVWTGGGFAGAGRTILPAGASAALAAAAAYAVQRTFINNGTVTVSNGTLAISGPGRFTNADGSTFVLTTQGQPNGPFVGVSSANGFEVQSGATLEFNSTQGRIDAQGAGTILIDGTIIQTGAGSGLLSGFQDALRINGQAQVQSGSLYVQGGVHTGQFTVAQGATLLTQEFFQVAPVFTSASSITGAGTLKNSFGGVSIQGTLDIGRLEVSANQGVQGTTELILGGTKRAGSVLLSGQTLLLGAATTLEVTGGFQQTGGRLQVRLGGAGQYGRVTVGGMLNLTGGPPVALEVIYWGGFAPSLGQTFNLITSGTRAGQFGTVVLPVQPPGMIADLNYLPGVVQLAIVPA